MDEIEYKLNTNNSVLIVNAIDKLISKIKSKYKPAERQKFVLENEELRFLREKCSSKEKLVSLTACQGLLALVELGVLEIAHTMSTVVTLLPIVHNYSAIISTMAGLLILDLRSRLVPGQPYRCQFSLHSPQHPFITVMEKNIAAEDDVVTQMHALCTHPDYVVSSNSLELLRPVFLWMTCNPNRQCSLRPLQLVLSLPSSQAQADLLETCMGCQQTQRPELVESAFSAYSAVLDNAIYQRRDNRVMALLPLLARISNVLVAQGRDPRACYTAIERGFSSEAPLRACAGLCVSLLASNLQRSAALHLHSLANLCLSIMTKYEISTLSLSTYVALSLQWLHRPSHLTAPALETVAKIIEIHRNAKQNSRLYLTNLKANQTFQQFLHTDSNLFFIFKLHETWERLRDDAEKIKTWLHSFESVGDDLKMELLPFFFGLVLENRQESWYEEVVKRALLFVTGLAGFKKEIAVQLLPVLVYKIASCSSPTLKWECLRAVPLMAKTKANVPTIVALLNNLKAAKVLPTSFLIVLYTNLTTVEARCFPYLQEVLAAGCTRPDDLKWEVELARSVAVLQMCRIRPSTHGLELVSVISSTLNRHSTDRRSALSAAMALAALAALWRGAAVAPPSAWQALKHKLRPETRSPVLIALCDLLSEIPGLRVSSPEYDVLIAEAARELWRLAAAGPEPAVLAAACRALQHYRVDDYKLKDVPEIFRRTVKLPASFCKTPADAARKPEDVLDYIPCEIWPEVFKHTNQAALPSVVQMATKLIDREIRGYRSGVYQISGRAEPTTVEYLPPNSVVRGLLECFRKQATNPTYEFPEAVLLSILSVLSAEYPRPLPPLELSWLHAASARGPAWRAGALRLAARAPQGSARRLVDVYLKEVGEGKIQESEAMELFELLPSLCRNNPPNALRAALERCLHGAYQDTLQTNCNSNDTAAEPLFAQQMKMVKACLECDKIHDANRTLLSQFVENYYNIMEDDNVAWAVLASTCCALPASFLERMTSPSSWWEVTAPALRRALAVRAQLACEQDLTWLNMAIDAQAGQLTDHEYSLACMLPALQRARPDDESRDWLLTLMARTQYKFHASDDASSKLYLCDVFSLSVAAFSGLATLAGDMSSRAGRAEAMPAAVATLCAKPAWREDVDRMLKWLCHTRDRSVVPELGQACRRAALALRHSPQFHLVWTTLDSHSGRHDEISDD